MQINPRRRDIAWNYAGTLLGIGGNFVLLPAMVLYLGGDKLGLWYVFMSIASLAQLMQFGFGPAFARNIAYCWSGAQVLTSEGLVYDSRNRETSFVLLRQLITVSRIVFGTIGLFAQLLIATLGTFHILHIAQELERGEYLLAWAVFCLAVFLNMYFAYFDALLRGVGGLSELNKAIVASNLVKIGVTVGLLVGGEGLLAAALGYFVQALVYRGICWALFVRYKEIGVRLRDVPRDGTMRDTLRLLQVVAPNAVRDGVVSLSNFLATTANSITCSVLLSLSETSLYSLSLQLVNAAANVSVVLISTYQPALQSAFSNRNRSLEVKWIAKGLASFYCLFFVSVLGLVFVVTPILNSLRDSFELDVMLLVSMALYAFVWKHSSVCAAYIANTNRIPYMLPFLLSSVGGAVLSIGLISFFGLGIWGLVLAPMCAQLAYNGWKWPAAISRELGVTYPRLLRYGFVDLGRSMGLRR